MWAAKRDEQWEHTSWMIAAMYNSSVNRKPGSEAVNPDDIHPFGGNFDRVEDVDDDQN